MFLCEKYGIYPIFHVQFFKIEMKVNYIEFINNVHALYTLDINSVLKEKYEYSNI